MLDVTLTLLQLAFVAAVLTVALQQIFDTRLYQEYFGKGVDGNPSKFLTQFELRPWISTTVGILLAFGFSLQAISSGLGTEYLTNVENLSAEAKQIDMILTGLIIGGGTKSIKILAKQFASAQQQISGGQGS